MMLSCKLRNCFGGLRAQHEDANCGNHVRFDTPCNCLRPGWAPAPSTPANLFNIQTNAHNVGAKNKRKLKTRMTAIEARPSFWVENNSAAL